MRRIVHVTLTFLPYSEAWLYDLVTAPVPYEARVVTALRENEDRFPFEPVLLIRAGNRRGSLAWFHGHSTAGSGGPGDLQTCGRRLCAGSPDARPLPRSLRPSRLPRRRRRAVSDDHELLRVRRARADNPRALGTAYRRLFRKGAALRDRGAGNTRAAHRARGTRLYDRVVPSTIE
jgi:hypothetical protein